MGPRGRCLLSTTSCFLLLMVTLSWAQPLSKRKPLLPLDIWTTVEANSVGIKSNVLNGSAGGDSGIDQVSDPIQGQEDEAATGPLDQEATVSAADNKQLQSSVAEKVKDLTVKLNMEYLNKTQTNTIYENSYQPPEDLPEVTEAGNRISKTNTTAPDIDSKPYVAFNIWTYEEGELKLSAVKKIPAEEVLGSDFYAQVTKNSDEPVLVLSDSFVLSNRNSTMPMLPLPQTLTTTTAPTSPTTTPTAITTTELPKVTNEMKFVHINAMKTQSNEKFTKYEDENLDFILNSNSSLSSLFPSPLVSPIGNIYDFVSFVLNNNSDIYPMKGTNSSSSGEIVRNTVSKDQSQTLPAVQIDTKIEVVTKPFPVEEQLSESGEMPEPVPEPEQMPDAEPEQMSLVEPVREEDEILEVIPEPTSEPEPTLESMAETEDIHETIDATGGQQEELASPDHSSQMPAHPEETHAVADTLMPWKEGSLGSSLNSVMLTPQGVKVASSHDDSVKTNAMKFLSAHDDYSLMFNINQSSVSPHKIQVSLINDEGIPTNDTSLFNANLISIISNKPTIINHNIYQIVQGGHFPTNNDGGINNDISSSKPYLVPSQVISDATHAHYPPPPVFQTVPQMNYNTEQKFTDKKTQTELSPEEQLLIELEKITSFNNILGGTAIDAVNDASIIETLALKGILDAKPEFVNLATEQIPGVDKKDHILSVANPKPGYANTYPATTYHHLQLNILPLGSTYTNFPNESQASTPSSSFTKNFDLAVLEHLLENNQLPTNVEIAILSDILAGSSISDALVANLQKFKEKINEHAKPELSDYNNPSPLTVIDAIEKDTTNVGNLSTPSSGGSSSSKTFITNVNVATLPPVRAATAANSPAVSLRDNLANCFQDRACTFAFSLALAAGTTGALTVPFITPLIGRSIQSTVEIAKAEIPNELMTVDDAKKIMAAVTKFAERNGKTMRGGDRRELREYLSPYVSYLGHKMFPRIFGSLPNQPST